MRHAILIVVSVLLAQSAYAVNAPAPAVAASERIMQLVQPRLFSAACCKTCRKGKACGDSCISKSKTCRKGVGCACDG